VQVIDTPTALLLAMEFAGGGELYHFVGAKGRLDEARHQPSQRDATRRTP
jgi:hypothetical protein